MAAAAPAHIPDPTVDFLVDAGNGDWTDANLVLAGTDVPIRLAPQHWLCVASGGSASVPFRQLEMAFCSALFFEVQAAAGLRVARAALNPHKMAVVLRIAMAAGLPVESAGSVEAALRRLVAFVRSKRPTMRVDFTVDSPGDFVSLPGPTRQHPALTAAVELWSEQLMITMAVDPDGDALVLSALLNLLPGRFTPAGRQSPEYKECVQELYDVAASKHTSMDTKTQRAQAACVAAAVASKVQDSLLLTFSPAFAAPDLARTYGFEGSAWLKPRFLEAWRHTYTNLSSLLTDDCSGRDAWAHASRLLFKEPTGELLSALDARIARLLSSIDSDASMRGEGVQITTRVAEMERLLGASASSHKSASQEGDLSTGASLKDPVEKAKLFARPEVKALVTALDLLNTTPLDFPKVIKELLTNDCPLGIIWMSGVKFAHPLFDKLLACREKPQINLACKKLMCKVDSEVKMDEFDRFDNRSGECPLPHLMVMGTFATSKGLHFNPWLDICSPRMAIVDGDHAVPRACDSLAALHPSAFFCSELMLRLGTEHITRAFTFIGLSEVATQAAPGTLASALETLRQDALRIDRLPDKIIDAEGTTLSLLESKDAARSCLRTAGARGFMDYAEALRAMLATPPESAKRPLEFAPDGCGLRTLEAKVETILKPMEDRLNQRLAINRSRPDLQPDYGIWASAGATGSAEASPSLLMGSPPSQTAMPTMGAPPAPALSNIFAMPPAAFASSPPMFPPPPPSATYIMPRLPPTPVDPAYSQLGPSASEAGGPTNVLALRDVKTETAGKGALAETIQWQGSGGWIQTPAGRQWLSLKHAGSKVIDIKKVCFGALLPPGMDPLPYCTGREKCKHAIPGGYSKVSSFDRALRDDELVTKRGRDESKSSSRSSRGRGGDRRRDGGGGGWGQGQWGSKGGGAQKGDWQQQGDWQPKSEWNAWNDWQGKGGHSGKGDWGGKGNWGGKGEGTGGAKGEWGYPASEKGKGKGKGKGEGGWSGRGWGY